MPVGAAIIGSSLLGAASSAYSAKKQASAIKSAQNSAIAAEERMFNIGRQDLAPWRQAGGAALGDLSTLYGLGGKAPDLSRFFTSPGYQFNLQEGQRAVDNTAAARGGALSGNTIKAQTAFASNLASGEFGNYTDTLMRLAGLGGQSAGQSAALAGQAGNTMANVYMNAGNARASAYGQGAAGVNNAIQGGLQNWVFQNYLNGGGGGYTPDLSTGYQLTRAPNAFVLPPPTGGQPFGR